MNMRTTALLLAAGLLTPGLAPAQTGLPGQPTAPQQVRPPQHQPSGMYEDIEILRRLLNARLVDEYPAVAMRDCARCHGGSPRTSGRLPVPLFRNATRDSVWGDLDNDGRSDLFITNGNGTFTDVGKAAGQPDLFISNNDGTLRWWVKNGTTAKWTRELEDIHRGLLGWNGGAGLDTEGVYLKGQGVAYTLTLPPPAHDPTAESSPAPPQPISPWDRIRRELHGGKPGPTEQKGSAPKEASLADIVLRVLAENGRHFTPELPENESITVVITFRGPEPTGAGGSGGSKTNPPGWPPTQLQQKQMFFKYEAKSTTGGQSSGQDYELLGDLSLKQGKPDEALKAYEKALKTEPDGARAAKLFPKIAQAYLAQGKVEEARRNLDRALEYAAKSSASPPPTKATPPARSPLPAKLILSAPRRLLDEVGNGRMPYDEFRKHASVNYLTFPAHPE